jgi:2-keto-4-pentenoate hydratase/2-oxohepta-3-ene-1,7-dioic acid hydratase in catechol pathway
VVGSASDRGFVEFVDAAGSMSVNQALSLRNDELLALERSGKLITSPLRYLAPIEPQGRLFCVGVNYRAHADEASRGSDVMPTIFIRTHESIVGHDEALRRPKASGQFDYEGELAIVIGKEGGGIPVSQALAHVGGYTCFNDGSIRDYQRHSLTAGKNFDATGACGPWIVTANDVPQADQLTLTTRVNGEVLQRASTGEMIYSIPAIIAYVSTIAELRTGDIISTGTPAGVGLFRDPQRWLVPGDSVEVSIDRVGVLRNSVEEAR